LQVFNFLENPFVSRVMRRIPHLDRQIADVQLMMELSDSKDDFLCHFERKFGKQLQLRFQLLKEMPELTA
jgi:hypothetical protein